MWDLSLKHSPICSVHKSKTAVLITGGAGDPGINLSQGIEFYRRLRLNDHPAVRLVQSPARSMETACRDRFALPPPAVVQLVC
jgi:hypothetical protein